MNHRAHADQTDDADGTSPRPRIARRRLVQATCGGLATVAWNPIPTACRAEEKRPPRFRFVQLNDTHVQAPLGPDDGRIKTYARANDKLRYCVDAFNRHIKPDFVLAIGDMIHGVTLPRLAADLDTFRELAAPLEAPLHPTPGNHEVAQREGDAEYERAYRESFGADRVSYSFEKDGLVFVMLNNSGAGVVDQDVIRRRNDWLRQTLATHRHQPKIIGCHIPVIPLREEAVLKTSFGFKTYHAHDPELLELIDSHAASIAAVLSGHLHLTGYVVRNGVYHVSICGTASFPSDFASFDVHGEHLDMTTHQLPADLATSAPSIHGGPRHAVEFTDAHHATPESYKMGRPDERRLVIPLRS